NPVLLAEVNNAADLTALLEEQRDFGKVTHNADELQAASASRRFGVIAHAEQGLLTVSASGQQVQKTMAFMRQPSANRFAGSRLYNRLAQAYQDGVGWLLAADLQQLVRIQDAQDAAHLQQTGLGDVQELVVEQKTGSGNASFQATLGFSQDRKGMASWLGAPSPLGALEFVSPNAYAVAGVVTKDPSLILDDVFSMMRGETNSLQNLQQFQAENHFDLRNDLAAPLGNEFLFALDGPLLPTPSWKVVIEVNDGARLQN